MEKARNLWSTIARWKAVSQQRRQLQRHCLVLAKDLGVSLAELEREANRPFWDPGPAANPQPAREDYPTDIADDSIH